MTVNADVVIDVFNSAISCLSSLLDTDVGGWIGGCVVLCFIIKFFRQLTNT